MVAMPLGSVTVRTTSGGDVATGGDVGAALAEALVGELAALTDRSDPRLVMSSAIPTTTHTETSASEIQSQRRPSDPPIPSRLVDLDGPRPANWRRSTCGTATDSGMTGCGRRFITAFEIVLGENAGFEPGTDRYRGEIDEAVAEHDPAAFERDLADGGAEPGSGQTTSAAT